MTLLPVFMLVSLNRWNSGPFFQLFTGVVWVSVQVSFIIGFLQPFPSLMLLAVALMFLAKCFAMHHKSTYLFGYVGLLIGSILLNFGSYSSFDLENFTLGIWGAVLMSLPICALAFYLFPDPIEPEHVLAVPAQDKTPRIMLEQTVLGWFVAMGVFVLFQVASLNDSLSAQASMIIMLAPMTLLGSMMAAKIRVIGTILGCVAAMVIQLLLYDLFDHVVLYILSYAIAAALFCRLLAKGPVQVGIGFSALSALTIPLTNSLVPGQQDAFFAILYRASSIIVAVIVCSVMFWLGYQLIQRISSCFLLERSSSNGDSYPSKPN